MPLLNECKTELSLSLPGRARIKIDALKSNPILAGKITAGLSALFGVAMVTANQYTAKVLVIYDINIASLQEVQERINQILDQHAGRSGESVRPLPFKPASKSGPGNGNPKTAASTDSTRSKVIRADFTFKKILPPKEFEKSKNTLSNEYYRYNLTRYRPVQNTSNINHTAHIPSADGLFPDSGQLPDDISWHTLTRTETAARLDTDVNRGLEEEQINARLEKFGLNVLKKAEGKPFLTMLLGQFDGFIIKLLLGAGGLSLLLGQVADALTILLILGLEALLGAWQEYKAEKTLNSLKQMTAPTAQVIRSGKKVQISACHLVPGDMLCLEAGNSVPADARIIESRNLEIVESSLTGEFYPAAKQNIPCTRKDLPLGDRINMVYMGTSVVKGNGKAIVVGTGMNTEMGKIAGMLHQSECEKTTLQKDLDRLARIITWGCLGICGMITLGGILGGHPHMEMLATGVSLSVGAIPEGLTTALAISLAFGAQRMARKKAIVKTMPSVEALSCMKVICTDKTGTLTKNEMTVKEIHTLTKVVQVQGEGYNIHGGYTLDGDNVSAGEHADLSMLLTAAVLCNNAEIIINKDGSCEIKGDPTEAAMLIAAEKSGIAPAEFKCYKREHEIPFDSAIRKMTAVCSRKDGRVFVFSKGAVDTILQDCTKVRSGPDIIDLTETCREQFLEANEKAAGKGLRVLALAYKPLEHNPGNPDDPCIGGNMIFLGLMGMMDPPRPEVKEALKKCREAGIKVVMITGDHKKTAESVARSIGLLTGKGRVVSGEELDGMDDEALADIIDEVQVFARTCPQQKLKIVKAFKRKGYIVAMTGDGINDAPALKEAHIGFAMGKSGTDIAKEVSSIILIDDNFNTIVKAVEEGRTINRNVKKFIKYVLSGNFAEVLVIFLASIAGLPSPLTPGQILMLNLVTEGVPALSLGLDPPEQDIMKEPPRNHRQSIFDHAIKNRIIVRGIATGLTTLAIFGTSLYFTGSLVKARTMAFVNLAVCQMLHALECSSLGVARNKYLAPAIAISGGLVLACLYIPALSMVFSMVPLTLHDWGSIIVSVIILSRLDDFLKDLLYVVRLRAKPSLGI